MAVDCLSPVREFVWGNLHNLKTNRYHPILFQYKPLPGGDGPNRWKSSAHHTDGFDTREQALEFIRSDDKRNAALAIERDFSWDGEDIPAMVVFFSQQDSDNNCSPLF